MDRGLFFLSNDEINKAAEQLLVCLASAKDARGLRVSFVTNLNPDQARVGVGVALTALTGCNFMPDNNVLMSARKDGTGFDVWPPHAQGGGYASTQGLDVCDQDPNERDSSGAGPRHL